MSHLNGVAVEVEAAATAETAVSPELGALAGL
jgi:hypothetical protein